MIAVRNRALFRNPQARALIFWIVALMDSAIAFVAFSMIAFRMPHKWLRTIFPTFTNGSSRDRAIHPNSAFQFLSAAPLYEYDHRPFAASLMRHALEVFRFSLVNLRKARLSVRGHDNSPARVMVIPPGDKSNSGACSRGSQADNAWGSARRSILSPGSRTALEG